MQNFSVSWSIDIETSGDHKAAAISAAQLCFKPHIAAGVYDSACMFTVTGPDGIPVDIDLCGSLSDLDGDDTQ